MNRLWNSLVRYIIVHRNRTGVEQDLNARKQITGDLAIPALKDACRQMAADGIVLLKNKDALLPISSNKTVAVFGRTAVDYFTVGYGSGGDVIAPYKSKLTEALRQAGVKLDEPLAAIYDKWCKAPANIPDEGYWGHWPMNYPEMPLKKSVVEEAAKRSDLALVVIGRAAGEDRENLLKKGSFYLTDKETKMLDLVTEAFEKVAVVIDCGNIIDMGWTEKYGDKISAILYAWQGGMESGNAVADLLTGKVNPSARLTDTIAKAYEDQPSAANFGGVEYNNYAEDIYVGYRYFETFCPEKVLYPFGFGLSYTTFEKSATATAKENCFHLSVTVKNTGAMAGKEVVQVYLGLPCGLLGNPKKVLAAFDKTNLLAPGESQTLTFDLSLADFASFDDSGVTGFANAFVLQEGNYKLYVGENVRENALVAEIALNETHLIKQLKEAVAVKPDARFDRMVNVNDKMEMRSVPTAKKDLRQQILDEIPEELANDGVKHSFDEVLDGRCTMEAFVGGLDVQELDDITHGEGIMNSSYGVSGNAGAFGGVTKPLRDRNMPAIITTDGPSGIRIRHTVALLPCQTALASSFDTKGIEALYRLIAQEMEHFGSDMLLAPGMNIHRNPLCGRNFEYSSEDPYLTGKIGAAAIRGIQSRGRSACPKHFACNSQEKNRSKNDSRVSPRALREIYLRGFEIAIKEANPMAIMTSYNKVNGVWSHYHYELVTQILRQEWGFEGLVITDWWMKLSASPEFPNLRDDAYRVRAQVDVLMPGDVGKKNDPYARFIPYSLADKEGLKKAEVQRCALNVVKFIYKRKQNAKV